jgi:hypothetical protein
VEKIRVTTSNKFKQLAKHGVVSDIYGFADGDFEVYCLLGCDTVYTTGRFLIMEDADFCYRPAYFCALHCATIIIYVSVQ